MKYRIEIEFRSAPAFEAIVDADTRAQAERITLDLARHSGWLRAVPTKARQLPYSEAEQYAAEQSATAVCLLASGEQP